MIARISGTLVEADLTLAVVDVHGVGYAVSMPMSTYDRLPRVGEVVTLLTVLHVREDLLQLYGFATVEERSLFELLLTVSGIGPRIALNVLSCLSVQGFCRSVLDADVKGLSRVNGIGKRSAERLVLELRDKVSDLCPEAAFADSPDDAASSRAAQDAIGALETLGFRGEDARKAVQALCAQLPKEQQSAENLIRRALGSLNP